MFTKLVLTTNFTDIMLKEKTALEALVTLIDGSDSYELMVHEKEFNLAAFLGAWKADFSSLEHEFISSVRRIYRTAYMDPRFRSYCTHKDRQTTCTALKAAVHGILIDTLKLQRCWTTKLSTPLPLHHSQDFRRNLSQAFGQMLFSQSYLTFNFTVGL